MSNDETKRTSRRLSIIPYRKSIEKERKQRFMEEMEEVMVIPNPKSSTAIKLKRRIYENRDKQEKEMIYNIKRNHTIRSIEKRNDRDKRLEQLFEEIDRGRDISILDKKALDRACAQFQLTKDLNHLSEDIKKSSDLSKGLIEKLGICKAQSDDIPVLPSNTNATTATTTATNNNNNNTNSTIRPKTAEDELQMRKEEEQKSKLNRILSLQNRIDRKIHCVLFQPCQICGKNILIKLLTDHEACCLREIFRNKNEESKEERNKVKEEVKEEKKVEETKQEEKLDIIKPDIIQAPNIIITTTNEQETKESDNNLQNDLSTLHEENSHVTILSSSSTKQSTLSPEAYQKYIKTRRDEVQLTVNRIYNCKRKQFLFRTNKIRDLINTEIETRSKLIERRGEILPLINDVELKYKNINAEIHKLLEEESDEDKKQSNELQTPTNHNKESIQLEEHTRLLQERQNKSKLRKSQLMRSMNKGLLSSTMDCLSVPVTPMHNNNNNNNNPKFGAKLRSLESKREDYYQQISDSKKKLYKIQDLLEKSEEKEKLLKEELEVKTEQLQKMEKDYYDKMNKCVHLSIIRKRPLIKIFYMWKTIIVNKHNNNNNNNNTTTTPVSEIELQRNQLEKDVQNVIHDLDPVTSQLMRLNYTIDEKKELKSSQYYQAYNDLKFSLNQNKEYYMQYLYTGDSYFNIKEYTKADEYYKKLLTIVENDDNKILTSLVTYKIAMTNSNLKLYNKACIQFEHSMGIAESINNRYILGLCHVGLGYLYQNMGHVRESLREAILSYEIGVELKDSQIIKDSYLLKSMAYDKLLMKDKAEKYQTLYNETNERLFNIVDKKIKKLNNIHSKLMGITPKEIIEVNLTRFSVLLPEIEKEISEIQIQIDEAKSLYDIAKKNLDDKALQLKRAREMFNNLHNKSSKVKKLFSIAAENTKYNEDNDVQKDRKQINETIRQITIDMKELNLQFNRAKLNYDVKRNIMRTLLLKKDGEHSNLSKQVTSLHLFRAASFDEKNRRNNSCVYNPYVYTSHDNYIFQYDTDNGRCMFYTNTSINSSKNAYITCLYVNNNIVYTGSTDTTVQVWDMNSYKRLATLPGHEGTVWSIKANDEAIVSGGTDCFIIIWDNKKYEMLLKMKVHLQTIKSIYLYDNMILTGSSEYIINGWKHSGIKSNYEQLERKFKLVGHKSPSSCLFKCGDDIISGSQDGIIYIWNCDTTKLVKSIKAHDGCIRSLQCDSLKLISGGDDNIVTVHDIISGSCLQTFYGHKDSILSVMFDNNMTISISSDNTIRQWIWNMKDQSIRKPKTYKLKEEDKIEDICEKYKTKEEDILKWNNVKDAKFLKEGLEIIVDNRDKNFEVSENRKIYRYDSDYNEIEVNNAIELTDENNNEKKELEMIFSMNSISSLPPI